jgi:hypothetical protein
VTITFSVFISTDGTTPLNNQPRHQYSQYLSSGFSVSVFYLELSSSLCCSQLDVFSLFFSLFSFWLSSCCNLAGEMLLLLLLHFRSISPSADGFEGHGLIQGKRKGRTMLMMMMMVVRERDLCHEKKKKKEGFLITMSALLNITSDTIKCQ